MGSIADFFAFRVADARSGHRQVASTRETRPAQIHDGNAAEAEPSPPITCCKKQQEGNDRRNAGGKVNHPVRPGVRKEVDAVTGKQVLECSHGGNENRESQRDGRLFSQFSDVIDGEREKDRQGSPKKRAEAAMARSSSTQSADFWCT